MKPILNSHMIINAQGGLQWHRGFFYTHTRAYVIHKPPEAFSFTNGPRSLPMTPTTTSGHSQAPQWLWPWPLFQPVKPPTTITSLTLSRSLFNVGLVGFFFLPPDSEKSESERQPSLINMLGFICDNSSWHNINGWLCPSEVSLMQMQRGKQLTFQRRTDDYKWQGYVNYRSQ